jgi:U32 family peptidase
MMFSSLIQKEKKVPELLAPAGSPEAFRAAVAAGADAIYLSGKRFGARRSARNFTDDELKEAVIYAHSWDIAVYVTINTLIHDRELPDVAEYLIWLYSIGVDAVLVQDTGVAALARDIVPMLPLHASTQMTIHSTYGVKWAAEQGFSRVVLARELSLGDITRISRETESYGIGLEVFAHGALCYCYSGQCLLSSVIGGRSGNRGMCAQPCRKPYTLMAGETDEYGRPTVLHEIPAGERYQFSPKDLCTYENLLQLVNSPVISLKIEGRMKSPEYVSVVVSTYRQALDAIAAGTDIKTPGALRDLSLAFNRGFTSGYLFEKEPVSLMGRDAPDNRGVCIGLVSRYDNDAKSVTVRLTGSVVPAQGDGLLLLHPENPRQKYGFSLNTVPVRTKGEITFKVPHPVEPGCGVFITYSKDLEMRARQITAHPPIGLRHQVSLDLAITIDSGNHLVFEGLVKTRRGKAIPLVYRSDFSLKPARSRPLTREQLIQQLRKTGATQFTIRNFTLTYPGNLFSPLAELNRARREFLILAEKTLFENFLPSEESVRLAGQRWNEVKPDSIIAAAMTRGGIISESLALGVYTDTFSSVKNAVNAGCDVIYFEPVFTSKECLCRNLAGFPAIESQIIEASTLCREAGIRFVLKFPRITNNKYFDSVLPEVSQTLFLHINGIMVESCGAAQALRDICPSQVLSGSTGLNIFNHKTVCSLSSFFGRVTLSPELSRDEIRLLVQTARQQAYKGSFALIVQGSTEAMVSENCLLKSWLPGKRKDGETGVPVFFGIMDETGHTFPVRIDGECRSHVFNSAEMCLIDHLPSLMQAGINEVVVDARGRTGSYTADMIRLYQEALHLAKKGVQSGDPLLEKLKDAVKRRAIGGITAGHFIRGLKDT